VATASYLELGAVTPEERRECAERICSSHELKRSARLRDLLRYIVQRSIDQEDCAISEREIGVHVFGRNENYDNTADNIVRVNASELRKRIGVYYSSEGLNEPVLLEIPRGSYTPHFARRPILEQMVEPPPTTDAESIVPPLASQVASSETKQWLLPAFFTLAILLAVTCTCLFLALRRAQRAAEPWRNGASLQAFWEHLFDDKRTTVIVLADSSLPLVQEVLKKRIPLNLYLKPDYTQALAHAELPENVRDELQPFASRSIASFTDFHAAKQILELAPGPGKLRLEYARRLPTESLKNENIILIGSNYSNPWVDLFDSRMNFHMSTDPLTHQAQIINSTPRAGEQAKYSSTPNDRDTIGYCTIAFFPGTEEEPSTLIVAGSTSEATEAAVDFVTSEKSMQGLREKSHIKNFSHFELLLRTIRLENTPLSAEIVAVRF
jgi:hypothetical protein